MQRVSLTPVAPRPPRRRRGPTTFAALLTAAVLSASAATPGAAECPWLVQPFAEGPTYAPQAMAYDILFEGLDPRAKVFYGFTVASDALAWQLAKAATLPEMERDARRLEPTALSNGAMAYELASDSVEPHTIYLVTANAVIDELERIEARIEPGRPVAVSQLLPRTRGATDLSGPLPRRSLPGFEIVSATPEVTGGGIDQMRAEAPSVQICAYQVVTR
jgi:hypothetical protein